MRQASGYLARRPFIPLAAGLTAGIAVSDALNLPPAWRWILLAAVVLVLPLLRRPLPTMGIPIALLLLGFAAGLWRHERAEEFPAGDAASHTFYGEKGSLVGRVSGPVRIYRRETAALDEARPGAADRADGSFVADIDSLEVGDRRVSGRLQVQFYDHDVDLRPGSTIRATGKLRTPKGATNPGGYDRREALLRQRIGATFVIAKGDTLEAAPPPPGSWAAVTGALADGLRDALRRHSPPRAAAFLSAILLGQREELPEELVLGLQRSGTAHFLAISGQNLVILLGVLWTGLFLAGLRGSRLNLALIGLLFLYASVTGWPVSVTRAFLMSTAVLAAAVLWRRSDTVNALGAAACAIAIADPAQVFEAGFQLSFLAVLGIIAVAPVFHDFLSPPGDPGGGRLAALVRASLGVSLAAWLATAPVVLHDFNLVTPVILVANLVLIPLMFLEMVLALGVVFFAFVAPPVADALGWTAAVALDATTGISTLLTRLPGSWLYLPAMPGWLMALYYAGLAAWTAWVRLRPGPHLPWLCGVLPLLMALPALAAGAPERQETAVLDVGRGSSQVVRTADGRVIVIDCGSLSFRDAGAAVTAPFLWSRGLTRIDLLVLSHADADHVNGVRSLAERFRIGAVAVSPYFARSEAGSTLLRWIEAQGIPVRRIQRSGPGPVEWAQGIEVLGPPAWPGLLPPENESSVVLRIGGVLFPGDIEEAGASHLMKLGPALRSRVLVAPHHGKFHKEHEAFAAAVAPELVLVSAPEGYSSAPVIAGLESRARVRTTGREGALIVVGP